MPKLWIGTSGWYYEHWDELFYKGIKPIERLQFYADHFETVEINNTFYHLPLITTMDNWHKKVPKKFIFSVKASRYITHMKRLKECKQPLRKLFTRVNHRKENLGPILFQLPPTFKMDLKRLEIFLKCLKAEYRYTFEFRHPSWFNEETYALLKEHQVALCITDLKGKLSPLEITSDFTYIRLHGPQNAYTGDYGTRRLSVWKERILQWKKSRIDVYCYFDNDDKSYAVIDAKRLLNLLSK